MEIDTWLMKWETTYEQCVQQKLPEVEGRRPMYDFLNAISRIARGFADVLHVKLLDEEASYDVIEIVKMFRDYSRVTNHRPKAQGVHGTFPTTLQSQGRTAGRKRLCLCGEDHCFAACSYLIEKNRPTGWTGDPGIVSEIEKKLERSKSLRTTVDGLRAKALELDEPFAF